MPEQPIDSNPDSSEDEQPTLYAGIVNPSAVSNTIGSTPVDKLDTNFTVDLKRYLLLELGYPNVEVELCDEQLDQVIRDTISAFMRFNAFNLLKYWKIALSDDQSTYDLPSDVRVVRDVNTMTLTQFDAIFATDVLVNPLYLRNSKDAYSDILTFWISEAAFNTWKRTYGLTTSWDIVNGNKQIRIYPLPRGESVAIIKGSYHPKLADVNYQMIGSKEELFRRMCLGRSMQILGRIRGKRVSGWRSSEGNVILDGEGLRSEGNEMVEKAMEELKMTGRPLGFYRE